MPRLELSGALLSARLLDFIKKHTRLAFKKTYMIVDLEIVRAMLQKESYGFNTFTGVRVGGNPSTVRYRRLVLGQGSVEHRRHYYPWRKSFENGASKRVAEWTKLPT